MEEEEQEEESNGSKNMAEHLPTKDGCQLINLCHKNTKLLSYTTVAFFENFALFQDHLNESSCSWPLCTFWIKLHLQVNAEFLQITTKPLQAKFLAQLDNLTDKLMQNFQGSKGAKGQKIKDIMAISSLYDDIDIKREHTLKSLVIYFNEDPDLLFKEYLTSSTEDERLRSTAATVTVFTPSEEKGFRSQRMLELSLKVLQL
uniref:uncharacterized protein LOC106675107 n=1 Tax=Maylandia zebra TaxID=106582 RepID=UPI0006CF129F|nr:uncharacterized protein LOC106675107 [Maylandia zebra]